MHVPHCVQKHEIISRGRRLVTLEHVICYWEGGCEAPRGPRCLCESQVFRSCFLRAEDSPYITYSKHSGTWSPGSEEFQIPQKGLRSAQDLSSVGLIYETRDDLSTPQALQQRALIDTVGRDPATCPYSDADLSREHSTSFFILLKTGPILRASSPHGV